MSYDPVERDFSDWDREQEASLEHDKVREEQLQELLHSEEIKDMISEGAIVEEDIEDLFWAWAKNNPDLTDFIASDGDEFAKILKEYLE